MSFGNFFENIQVFVATGMGHIENNEGTKKDKERNAGGFDTDIFFFLFLFILFSRWRGRGSTPARGFVMLSSS